MRSIFHEIQKDVDDNFERLIAYADYYTEDLFLRSKDPDTVLLRAKKEIIACVENLIGCSKNCPKYLFSEIENLEVNVDGLLDIVTLYAHNSKAHHFTQKYAPKPFQYVHDYNGLLKVTAMQKPPYISKGSTRDTRTFKVYNRKLYNSISRSKQKVYELAKCNDWEYFATFTINKQLFDRYDLDSYIKAFTKWLSNYSARKTNGKKIDYILIPELDNNGAWHLHGLINGIPLNHLSLFERGKHPNYLVDNEFLNWEAYSNKFGFCSLGKLHSKEKAAGYITKYIRKSLITQERGLHSRLYFTSQGLKHSTELYRGYYLVEVDAYDFENEYVGSKQLNEKDAKLLRERLSSLVKVK